MFILFNVNTLAAAQAQYDKMITKLNEKKATLSPEELAQRQANADAAFAKLTAAKEKMRQLPGTQVETGSGTLSTTDTTTSLS